MCSLLVQKRHPNPINFSLWKVWWSACSCDTCFCRVFYKNRPQRMALLTAHTWSTRGTTRRNFLFAFLAELITTASTHTHTEGMTFVIGYQRFARANVPISIALFESRNAIIQSRVTHAVARTAPRCLRPTGCAHLSGSQRRAVTRRDAPWRDASRRVACEPSAAVLHRAWKCGRLATTKRIATERQLPSEVEEMHLVNDRLSNTAG